MTRTHLAARASVAVATTLTAAVTIGVALAPAASASSSCVGQLASTSGSMAAIVHGWQNGQPAQDGFTVPGDYASHLAQAPLCP